MPYTPRDEKKLDPPHPRPRSNRLVPSVTWSGRAVHAQYPHAPTTVCGRAGYMAEAADHGLTLADVSCKKCSAAVDHQQSE